MNDHHFLRKKTNREERIRAVNGSSKGNHGNKSYIMNQTNNFHFYYTPESEHKNIFPSHDQELKKRK